MNGKNDLLNDILPMVIYGILDPKYVNGEESEEDKGREKDSEQGEKERSEGENHG